MIIAPEEWSDNVLNALGNFCPRLKKLSTIMAHPSDSGVKAIAEGCCHIETVDLGIGRRAVTSKEVIKLFTNCKHLSSFQCTGIDGEIPSDQGLGDSLVEVNLAGSVQLTSIRFLAGCPLLKKVSFAESINLGSTIQLSDLVNCPLLEEIDLSDCDLSDEALATLVSLLPQLPLLRKLPLGTDKRVTKELVLKLTSIRPGLKMDAAVIFE